LDAEGLQSGYFNPSLIRNYVQAQTQALVNYGKLWLNAASVAPVGGGTASVSITATKAVASPKGRVVISTVLSLWSPIVKEVAPGLPGVAVAGSQAAKIATARARTSAAQQASKNIPSIARPGWISRLFGVGVFGAQTDDPYDSCDLLWP
jgi:hypothetical protein